MIHVATDKGFSKHDIVLIEDEFSKDGKDVKSVRFGKALKEIVENIEMIPDKSVLLIRENDHRQMKVERQKLSESHGSNKMKKRESLSQVRKFNLRL